MTRSDKHEEREGHEDRRSHVRFVIFVIFVIFVFPAMLATAACQRPSTATKSPSSDSAAVTVQPGAPGQPSKTLSAAPAAKAPAFTEGDVKFMQGMIGHHAQAVEMVELLKTRTKSQDMQQLGKRIEISQNDEIKMMQQWLRERGQQAPMGMAHEHAALMPGMLTPEEMQKLAGAKGPAFDRLFLEGMIKHHGGALVMVKELMSQQRAAEDAALFQFASDVEADQTMEIHRMQLMLAKRKSGTSGTSGRSGTSGAVPGVADLPGVPDLPDVPDVPIPIQS